MKEDITMKILLILDYFMEKKPNLYCGCQVSLFLLDQMNFNLLFNSK